MGCTWDITLLSGARGYCMTPRHTVSRGGDGEF